MGFTPRTHRAPYWGRESYYLRVNHVSYTRLPCTRGSAPTPYPVVCSSLGPPLPASKPEQGQGDPVSRVVSAPMKSWQGGIRHVRLPLKGGWRIPAMRRELLAALFITDQPLVCEREITVTSSTRIPDLSV